MTMIRVSFTVLRLDKMLNMGCSQGAVLAESVRLTNEAKVLVSHCHAVVKELAQKFLSQVVISLGTRNLCPPLVSKLTPMSSDF